VEAVRALVPELVRPLSRLRAVILQAPANPGEVAVFLFEGGRLRGPGTFLTIGMRIQNEQSGSTSLFAQPMAMEAVVSGEETKGEGTGNREQATERQGTSHPSEHRSLAGDPGREQGNEGAGEAPARIPRTMLEARLEEVLAELSADAGAPSSTIRQGHLALLKRWYYRPEARRAGEIFFPDAEGRWPVKAILRGIGRVAAKAFAPATQT